MRAAASGGGEHSLFTDVLGGGRSFSEMSSLLLGRWFRCLLTSGTVASTIHNRPLVHEEDRSPIERNAVRIARTRRVELHGVAPKGQALLLRDHMEENIVTQRDCSRRAGRILFLGSSQGDESKTVFSVQRKQGKVRAEEIETYLAALGSELQTRGVILPLRVLLIGGAYMLLVAHSPRPTDDVDFFWVEEGVFQETLSQETFAALNDSVQAIAERYALTLAGSITSRRCSCLMRFGCRRAGCGSALALSTFTLPKWYTLHPENQAERAAVQRMAPAPFARRNIFCTNRLFQNKYEMYTWIQEAIEQGLTNPSDIHQYARQKEISLHGA